MNLSRTHKKIFGHKNTVCLEHIESFLITNAYLYICETYIKLFRDI